MAQLKDLAREHWAKLVVGLAVLAIIWWQWRPQPKAPTAEEKAASWVSVTTSSSMSSNGPKAGFVHIKGAVVHPGLYPVTTNTRWDEVVKAAGGLTPEADVSQVNLAQIASDQDSLLIPVVGQASATPAAPTASGSGAQDALVNLNTATAAELQTLSGVGPKKAADIIAYREENGGFKTVEDLKQVSGIGEKTFERLAPAVTVGP